MHGTGFKNNITTVGLLGMILVTALLIALSFVGTDIKFKDFGQQSVELMGDAVADGTDIGSFTSLSCNFSEKEYHSFSVTGFLSRAVRDTDFLLMHGSNISIELYKGDELLYSSANDGMEGLDGEYENIWIRMPTGGISASDEITLSIKSNINRITQKNLEAALTSLSVCDGKTMYSSIVSDLTAPVFMLILTIIASAFAVMFSFIVKSQTALRRTGIVLIMMVLCGWRSALDFQFSNLSLIHNSVRSVNMSNYFPIFAVGVIVPFYVLSVISENRRKRIALISALAAAAAFSAATIMLLAGVRPGSFIIPIAAIQISAVIINGALLLSDGIAGKNMVQFYCAYPLIISAVAGGIAVFIFKMPHVFGFSAGFIISVILRFLFSFDDVYADAQRAFNAKKTETELDQSRIEIMLSQIRPHFMFNSLTAIKQLCLTKPEKAVDAIDHFAGFLRNNIDSVNRSQMILFSAELDLINNYLYLEQMRIGQRLKVEYDIDADSFMLPALSVQPIVENAVRYGISKKPEGGTLRIITRELESAYLVIVSDDGVGFDTAAKKNDGRSHVGISNVRSRLDYQCGGTLTISSRPGEGTVATVTIPK